MKSITFFILMVLLAAAPVQGTAQETPVSAGKADRAVLDGIELRYEVRGAGEPVVLVHAGVFADWFTPLLQERALTSRYRILSYDRIGYAGSSRVAGPVSLAQQAAHAGALMRYLGIERAHIVGHSSTLPAAILLCSSHWMRPIWSPLSPSSSPHCRFRETRRNDYL